MSWGPVWNDLNASHSEKNNCAAESMVVFGYIDRVSEMFVWRKNASASFCRGG